MISLIPSSRLFKLPSREKRLLLLDNPSTFFGMIYLSVFGRYMAILSMLAISPLPQNGTMLIKTGQSDCITTFIPASGGGIPRLDFNLSLVLHCLMFVVRKLSKRTLRGLQLFQSSSLPIKLKSRSSATRLRTQSTSPLAIFQRMYVRSHPVKAKSC
jgi:hypothetical protein